MERTLKAYIFYEIGDACRTEFLMTDGEFHATEDAVVLGTSVGETAEKALVNLKKEYPHIQEYITASIVAREIGKPFYL